MQYFHLYLSTLVTCVLDINQEINIFLFLFWFKELVFFLLSQVFDLVFWSLSYKFALLLPELCVHLGLSFDFALLVHLCKYLFIQPSIILVKGNTGVWLSHRLFLISLGKCDELYMVRMAEAKTAKVCNTLYNRVFHDLFTTQEWQYCQLHFGHVIQN